MAEAALDAALDSAFSFRSDLNENGRLPGFDYKSPFYYMVTLKRLKGLAAFSEISERGIVPNAITRAFEKTIRSFHAVWRCCDEISPFAIMPDHLHLLIKIRPTPDRVALGVLVSHEMVDLAISGLS